MRITALTENTCFTDKFECEHGLSLFIETENHNILFDSGQSDMFVRNAEKLNIDLSKVDIAFLSHGHYDHGGGIKAFLAINSHSKIYLNKNALGDFYSNPTRYIGLDKKVFSGDRFVFTDDYVKIDDELSLYTFNDKPRKYVSQSMGLLMKKNNEFVQDDFTHEHYLVISENNKNTLISGCSHKGILNILEYCNDMDISYFVGGLHISKVVIDEEGKKILDNICNGLEKSNMIFYTCHCTGVDQFNYLKMYLKDSINYISSGKLVIL